MEKACGIMDAVVKEIRGYLFEDLAPQRMGEGRERWIERAAKAAGISFRSARSFFYNEISDPKTSVTEQIRKAHSELNRQRASISTLAKEQQNNGNSQTFDDMLIELRRAHDAIGALLSLASARAAGAEVLPPDGKSNANSTGRVGYRCEALNRDIARRCNDS